MASLKIIIIGYGKMGRMIEAEAISRGHQVTRVVDNEGDWEHFEESAGDADVAIEFTQPDAAMNNFRRCIETGISVVTGTTGWHQEKGTIQKLVEERNGAFLFASNFSIGMNLFFELNRNLAMLTQLQSQYSASIREIHHIRKHDKPSGTAITLANDIISLHKELKGWSLDGSKSKSELPIFAIREGNATGTHIVSYSSEVDFIELKHEAHNRRGFAQGAVLAAEWIHNRKGFFDFREIISQILKSKD